MTTFARPKPRFDSTQANDGVWFGIYDEFEYHYGDFKSLLFDPSVPRVRIISDRMTRVNTAKSKNKPVGKGGNSDRRFGVELFVEACLVDWDLKDQSGKAITFSKEKALEYFNAIEIDEATGETVYIFDFAINKLIGYAKDVHNFQSDEQILAGDPAKN